MMLYSYSPSLVQFAELPDRRCMAFAPVAAAELQAARFQQLAHPFPRDDGIGHGDVLAGSAMPARNLVHHAV